MSGWRMQEYQCEAGHRFESLERVSELPDWLPCECGSRAERAISAVREKPVYAWAVSQAKTEMPPWAFDCRKLAEGQSHAEFRAESKERAKKAPWYKDPFKSTCEELGLK